MWRPLPRASSTTAGRPRWSAAPRISAPMRSPSGTACGSRLSGPSGTAFSKRCSTPRSVWSWRRFGGPTSCTSTPRPGPAHAPGTAPRPARGGDAPRLRLRAPEMGAFRPPRPPHGRTHRPPLGQCRDRRVGDDRRRFEDLGRKRIVHIPNGIAITPPREGASRLPALGLVPGSIFSTSHGSWRRSGSSI